MPAGNMERIEEQITPEQQKQIDEVLKKTDYKQLLDDAPIDVKMVEKDDLDKLFYVIKSKGYLSTETAQECNMIKWAISNSFNNKDKDEEVLKKCHEFFAFTLNLANMFLLHYRTCEN